MLVGGQTERGIRTLLRMGCFFILNNYIIYMIFIVYDTTEMKPLYPRPSFSLSRILISEYKTFLPAAALSHTQKLSSKIILRLYTNKE